jgi:hypothetical protein
MRPARNEAHPREDVGVSDTECPSSELGTAARFRKRPAGCLHASGPRLASEEEEQPVSDRPYPIGDPPADYPLGEPPDDDDNDEEDTGRTGPFWSCAR